MRFIPDTSARLFRTLIAACVTATLPALAASCSDGGGGEGGGPITGGKGGTVTVTHPGAPPLAGQSACTVTEDVDIPETSANHDAICTSITYATNPPSGGDHWPIWAKYQKYDKPLPHEMLVHDMEHGAIVLLYRCAEDCPDVVEALTQVFGSIADPLCLTLPGGPPARMVLAPDPDLPAPIAAAAWGATYTATCIDVPSLQKFANDHYGKGTEDLCADGVDPVAMPPCGDGGGG